MHLHFTFTDDQRAKVFNKIFADHLRECGLSRGLGEIALRSQYRQMSKTDKPNSAAPWNTNFAKPSDADEARKREMIVGQIASVAKTLGIDVSQTATPRTQQPGREKAPIKRRHLRVMELAHDDSNRSELDDDSDEYEVPPTPTPTRAKRAASRMLTWAIDGAHSATTNESTDVSDDDTPLPLPKRAKLSRKSPEVVLPITPKRAGRPRTEAALIERNHWYPRPNGGVWMTPQKYHIAMQELVPPKDAEAHPPLAGLLFR